MKITPANELRLRDEIMEIIAYHHTHLFVDLKNPMENFSLTNDIIKIIKAAQ